MADAATEKDVLLGYLGAQRQHVLSAIDGLSDDQMRSTSLPSRWSVMGLINHLALDDEMFWFQCVVGGDEVVAATLDDGWQVDEGEAPQQIVEKYQTMIGRSDEVLASVDLDAPPAWWPEFFGSWRLETVREVLMHVVTETCCHAGHLDVVRELADGHQWRVLT